MDDEFEGKQASTWNHLHGTDVEPSNADLSGKSELASVLTQMPVKTQRG